MTGNDMGLKALNMVMSGLVFWSTLWKGILEWRFVGFDSAQLWFVIALLALVVHRWCWKAAAR
jgi:hypothetical protein